MRKTILLLMFLCCGFAVSAQTVRLRPAVSGKVSVTRGKIRSVVDLSDGIAGCAYTSGKYKRELDKNECAAPPASFKLIDAVVESNRTFLVIQSDAMGNCNVCGHCGASESYALIWLKLNARLHILDRKTAMVEDCLGNISSVETKQHEDDNLSDLTLNFKRNILIVEYEKTLFGENSDISGYEFSHLEYNRKTPEKGFVIKTEKRVKSSI